jgi:hypothetical protein
MCIPQVLLFVPVCTLAPLCAGLEVQREAWIQLVLWTLQRAGAFSAALFPVMPTHGDWRAMLHHSAVDATTNYKPTSGTSMFAGPGSGVKTGNWQG